MPQPADDLRVDVAQQRPIPLAATLDCARGEVLALVGPSGSGKSTILRAIAGVYTPERGRIDAGGRDVARHRGGRAAAGARALGRLRVPELRAVPASLRAVDNVMQAMGHVPAHERRERARSLLERTHLAGLEDRRPAQLSGGQQQRVAVARALARDPTVLLLDEPFSAVDQVTREKLYEELATLRRDLRIPMVLVTHALDEASMLADRMCILHRGSTLQTDTPQAVADAAGEPAGRAARRAQEHLRRRRSSATTSTRTVTHIRWFDPVLDARPRAAVRGRRAGRLERAAVAHRAAPARPAVARRARESGRRRRSCAASRWAR